MKIERMDVGMIEFGELCVSEVFADAEDIILMKIFPMNDEDGKTNNAVNLLTGRLDFYNYDEKVKPVRARLVVE